MKPENKKQSAIIMEWSFFILSLVLTGLTLGAFLAAYFNWFNSLKLNSEEVFNTTSEIYCLAVGIYGFFRKANNAQYPDRSAPRWSERIVLVWMTLCAFFLPLTLFCYPDKWVLFKSLGMLNLVLGGILITGEALSLWAFPHSTKK